MSEKVKVSFYVAAPVARAIRLLAAREERSQSDIAGEAFQEYLQERQEHLDWLRASEPAFAFWQDEVDGAYDAL